MFRIQLRPHFSAFWRMGIPVFEKRCFSVMKLACHIFSSANQDIQTVSDSKQHDLINLCSVFEELAFYISSFHYLRV